MNRNKKEKTFTIIIPAWPNDKRPFGLDYIDRIQRNKTNLEVILARGFSPCRQRNQAAKVAKGDILIFFDDDSCPQINFLDRLDAHFQNPDIVGVGGPNPALNTKKFFPKLVEAAFQSELAVLSKVARYKPTGRIRPANDSDLIFCNFAIRRKYYLKLGGLDERLCPNEENEFFERLHDVLPPEKLLYDPELIAREPRPCKFTSFFKKIYGYGRGRARQFKIRHSFFSLFHLALALMPAVPVIAFLSFEYTGLAVLFCSYAALLILAASLNLIRRRSILIAVGLIPVIATTHLAYILGICRGIFESKNLTEKKKRPIKIEYYLEIKNPKPQTAKSAGGY